MKELEDMQKDKVKIENQKQIEKQLQFIGDTYIRPGQKCFEYEIKTASVRVAEIEVVIHPFATGVKIDMYLGTKAGRSKYEQKVVKKDGCLYVIALNETNARKKILKSIK